CFPGRRIASEERPLVMQRVKRLDREVNRVEESKGKFHRCCRTGRKRNPLTINSLLEVQYEDGEKPSARHCGGSRRDGRCAGGRSSRQGQAGPVREDLLALWCWLLLYAGHGYLHQGRRLRARRSQLQRRWLVR